MTGVGTLEEAKEWARAGAADVVEYCTLNIDPDAYFSEARWMARLSGSAWALGRYISKNWNLTDDEYNAVTNSWFDIVVEGLQDNHLLGDDRAEMVS